MSFEDNMVALGRSTSAAVLALWEQYQAGILTLEEFHEAAALTVETGRAQGAVIGALTVAAYLEVLSGIGVDIQAPRLPSVFPKLLAAMVTITGSGGKNFPGVTNVPPDQPEGVTTNDTRPERVPMQLERLATAEVQDAAQQGMQDAIEDAPETEGWTRDLDKGACDFCKGLKADENGVMPKGARMAKHNRCACTPLPVIKTQVIVAKQGKVYRRGVGWMTREQAEVWDVTREVPPLDSLPPRQFVPAGSLTDEEIAALPGPRKRSTK